MGKRKWNHVRVTSGSLALGATLLVASACSDADSDTPSEGTDSGNPTGGFDGVGTGETGGAPMGTGGAATGGATTGGAATGGTPDGMGTGGDLGTGATGGECGMDDAGTVELFRVTPYLQNSKGTSITILTIANQAVAGKVEVYNPDGECRGSVEMEAVKIPESPSYYRLAGKLGGLAPDIEYGYRVVLTDDNGDEDISARATFRTLNPSGDDGRFVVLSDNHDNFELNAIQAGYAAEFDPDLFFYNGDTIDDFQSSADECLDIWQKYVTSGRHHEVTMDFIVGNHEWRGGWEEQLAYLLDTDVLDPNVPKYERRYQRAFTHASTRFIYLDGGEDGDKSEEEFRPMREAQAQWLKDEVDSMEFKTARYRVLLMHMPLWGFDDEITLYLPYFQDTVRNATPQFDLALFAHTHTAAFMDADEEHPFPVFIGGDKSTDDSTNIQVVIDGAEMRVEMRDYENQLMDSVIIPAP